MIAIVSKQRTKNPLLLHILEQPNLVARPEYSVHSCWVPSQIGISGNELAGSVARNATAINALKMQLPYLDYKKQFSERCSDNGSWNGTVYKRTGCTLLNQLYGTGRIANRTDYTKLYILDSESGTHILTHNYLL